MNQVLTVVASVLALWAVVAGRLERWRITAPIIMVVAGAAMGITTKGSLGETLNTEVALKAAEIILAILLFSDAAEVRGGLLGRERWSALRLLFVALPLSIGLAMLLGGWLLPGLAWSVLLVIACAVVPIDFAPATAVVRDARFPQRLRTLLNVESGYNDGIVSPIFLGALVLAGGTKHGTSVAAALQAALPTTIKAVLVGLAVGVVLALLTNAGDRQDLMTEQSKRVAVVAAPILAFALSAGMHGNGFVAAFVCGIVYRSMRDEAALRRELELLDDLGFLLTVAMWFVFGSVAVLVVTYDLNWRLIAFGAAVLTVVRVGPVLLSMLGSDFSWRDRLLVGWLGPRGTASIVFGLMAFNVLDGRAAETTLSVMVIVVLGSVIFHGAGSAVATGVSRLR
ncbi:cation:proton antiporter [Nocardia farcinica]|uniref:cation:proton antiporter domain-containing protein n=1 Tax=Nocardia farcinica TaxID=37329 RepID=UPI0018950F69|nr:cation:proton antiporter [Nocardia farcinica]MBF6388029.1 cation:proton antiporter [Nocardia farcinica]